MSRLTVSEPRPLPGALSGTVSDLEPVGTVELLANLPKVALMGYIPELGPRPIPHLR